MIRVLIIVVDSVHREQLENAVLAASDLAIAGAYSDFVQSNSLNPTFPKADIVIVDLAHAEAPSCRLWGAIHIIYPAVRIIAMVEPPLGEDRLQAAIHAGVYAFVEWAAPISKFHYAIFAACTGEPYFNPPWLLGQLAELFTRLNMVSRGIIQIGLLRVDLDERGAYLANHPLLLSRLEFDTLRYLALNSGRVVRPDELLREVWYCDLNTGGTANEVSCCIKRLRRKL
jgi:hypothetical protein